MDSESTSLTIIWTAVMISLATAIFLISGCVQDQNEKAKVFAAQCVAAGHKYIDTDKVYGMCI